MTAEARFLLELTDGIMASDGTSIYTRQKAALMAGNVWRRLVQIGSDAYPCLVQEDDLRFVYQWDEFPPVLTVMFWDEQMWRNMVQIVVPNEVAP